LLTLQEYFLFPTEIVIFTIANSIKVLSKKQSISQPNNPILKMSSQSHSQFLSKVQTSIDKYGHYMFLNKNNSVCSIVLAQSYNILDAVRKVDCMNENTKISNMFQMDTVNRDEKYIIAQIFIIDDKDRANGKIPGEWILYNENEIM
jgi:hypothetical protein